MPLAIEKPYTPSELAELWNLSPSKVRELFADESGVIRIGEPSRRQGKKLTRAYCTLRIPESVAIRSMPGSAPVRNDALDMRFV
jgi:hypothetical protein